MQQAQETIVIRPQEGPQEAFLASSADIVIAGGAAGGGKTWGLLLEPMRHRERPDFAAVVFRRTYPMITNKGGLWTEASKLYPYLGATPHESKLEYTFPSGMTVKFAHMQHEKDRFSWAGSQVPLLCFDQLEEFEETQFWFLLSRNRSARAGVSPYVRATCNPVPPDDETGGWLARLISWWWDPDTGYPIAHRSGLLRWFVRGADEQLHWGDSAEELRERFPGHEPKSLTFVPSFLGDNPILERNDPGYRATLNSLPRVERERLLHGNWKIKASAGLVFDRAWFKVLTAMPDDVEQWARYWDKAGTEGGGKYSAGVLTGRRRCGRYLIASSIRGQWSSGNREAVIRQVAHLDQDSLGRVDIWVEQEPGSGGKESAENTIRGLAGFTVRKEAVTGSKLARAGPLSSQAEAGNVDVLQGPWVEAFLSEMQNFDGERGYMDQVDAASGGFNKVSRAAGWIIPGPISFEKPLDTKIKAGYDPVAAHKTNSDDDDDNDSPRRQSWATLLGTRRRRLKL